MQAEIISIGTELLLGDIIDTNSKYIAEKLKDFGYDVHYITTVGDNKEKLSTIFKKAITRSDLIISTGGLGPTDDDLTRDAVAEATNKKLYRNEQLLKDIKKYFKNKGYNMTKNNYSQAYLPQGAQAIINKWGTAPGIYLKTKDYEIINLPGVPQEMKNIFEDTIISKLARNSSDMIMSKTLNFFGIGESTLESKLYDILEKQNNPTLALLAGKGEVKIRITAKATKKEVLTKLIMKEEEKIRNKVGEYIYGVDDTDLSEEVNKLFKDNNMTLSLAESCTGGLISHRITNVPGSSKIFKGGFVVYSNKSKINFLDIDEKVIESNGAVSEIVAKRMSENVLKKFNTDIGVGVTGIAGPGGGTKNKDVGLVYIAISTENKTYNYKLNLKGDRLSNKWMTSQYLLYYLLKIIKKMEG